MVENCKNDGEMQVWIAGEIRQENDVLFKGTKRLECDESFEQTFEKWYLTQIRDSDVGVSTGFHGDKHTYS